MFVRNRTQYEVVLARGHLTDELAVASLNIDIAYGIEADLRLTETALSAGLVPDISKKSFWQGVSVTASGAVTGPTVAPYVKSVKLRVGDAERRLVVFGSRRWHRGPAGHLLATAPAPFDSIPLSWKAAFGGSYDLPPGFSNSSGHPSPGGHIGHPLNPTGTGFYRDEDSARDQPLPTIEQPEALIKAWNDDPEPAGFSPCPDLPGMRLGTDLVATLEEAASRGTSASKRDDVQEAFFANYVEIVSRIQHYAPARLIFPQVLVTELIELEGVGASPLRFAVPTCPVKVAVRGAKGKTQIQAVIRRIHLNADARSISVVFGSSFRYSPQHPPSWVEVTAANS